MRKLSFVLLVSLAVGPTAALADTIHLKNGSVLKGKVASFADDQFVVMLDTGSGRYLSRAMVYIGDVARIEFDGAPAGSDSASSDTSNRVGPRDTQLRDTASPRDTPARDTQARDTTARDTTARDTTARDSQPRNTSSDPFTRSPQPSDTQPREPAASDSQPTTQPDRPAASSSTPALDTQDSDRSTRRNTAPGKTTTIEVIGKRDWTSTGLIVHRGDRVRITASGTVTIDPATGRTTGPEGSSDIPDVKKPMPSQATGALIAVIGADNDDFIFVGRSAEFTATRDGLLFLSVNEETLADNLGSYRATIEVQSSRK